MDEDYFLIRKMKKGDEIALKAFVQKHYPQILKYCYRRLNGSNLAEDITQETFENFFRNLYRYEHYGKARNYLYTIAGHLCRNYYRQRTELTLEEICCTTSGPEADIIEEQDMKSALMKLPEDLRDVLILHYFQDLKLREIASILKISLPLVKYRLARAREILKEAIGEEDGLWTR